MICRRKGRARIFQLRNLCAGSFEYNADAGRERDEMSPFQEGQEGWENMGVYKLNGPRVAVERQLTHTLTGPVIPLSVAAYQQASQGFQASDAVDIWLRE